MRRAEYAPLHLQRQLPHALAQALDHLGVSKILSAEEFFHNDPEEVKRQISISLAVAPLEFKGCKINVLDTPGGFDFSGEVMEALRAADAAIIVCSAKDGISVGLEKAWKFCAQHGEHGQLPHALAQALDHLGIGEALAVEAAFVFKTVSDQYGKYSYIKVLSGVITSDLSLINARTGSAWRRP